MDKVTVVKYSYETEKFEILVKPDPAFDYKLGKISEISKILVSDEIYTNSGKGTRASNELLLKVFKTDDTTKIAEIMMQKGELNLTTEQRKKMTSDKRKQIVTFISKTYVDPKTHLPHPPLRIEQAMTDGRVSVDPFKNPDEQIKDIVEKLRPIIPLKTENLTLEMFVTQLVHLKNIEKNNFESGILNLTSLHTSCSLTINENADPNVLRDLKKYIQS
ncbi:MAG: ribosome assembly factor SBDS, partial [Thermoproteota archaeon]|nr:ribosome assembly factor SBDS [Thermoproteota archaeon]